VATAVGLIGLALAILAILDRRAWPFLGVVALAWLMTWSFDRSLPVLAALLGRVVVDALGALLAWGVEGRVRPWGPWMAGVRVTFVLMLLAHAVFWLARSFGLDVWPAYAHGLNALALAQLLFIASPGGMRLADVIGGLVRHRLGRAAARPAGGRAAGRGAAPVPVARPEASHARPHHARRRPHG
jgi:hypothetical protein